MHKFSVNDVEGVVINKDTVYERTVKLFASPDCVIKRDEYACGMTVIDIGQAHEEHAHSDSRELILVFQGSGIAIINGEELVIKQGDVIALEEGEAHAFKNIGGEKLCLYWVYSPPGPEKKFLIGAYK